MKNTFPHKNNTHDWRRLHEVDGRITSIQRISTGDVFSTGDFVYHKEYEKIIGPIRFDEALLGHTYFEIYYEGFVRADSGIYSLLEILPIAKKVSESPESQYLLLG